MEEGALEVEEDGIEEVERGQIDLIEIVAEQVESGEEDVNIGGDIASMSNSGESGSDESILGSSSSDGDEYGDGGHDIVIPQAMETGGVDGGDEEGNDDEEGKRAQVRSLEDLVATLQQQQMEDRDQYRRVMEEMTIERDQIAAEKDKL